VRAGHTRSKVRPENKASRGAGQDDGEGVCCSTVRRSLLLGRFDGIMVSCDHGAHCRQMALIKILNLIGAWAGDGARPFGFGRCSYRGSLLSLTVIAADRISPRCLSKRHWPGRDCAEALRPIGDISRVQMIREANGPWWFRPDQGSCPIRHEGFIHQHDGGWRICSSIHDRADAAIGIDGLSGIAVGWCE